MPLALILKILREEIFKLSLFKHNTESFSTILCIIVIFSVNIFHINLIKYVQYCTLFYNFIKDMKRSTSFLY